MYKPNLFLSFQMDKQADKKIGDIQMEGERTIAEKNREKNEHLLSIIEGLP